MFAYFLKYYYNTFSAQVIFIAGWSSLVARRAHNPKAIGSNPIPATIFLNLKSFTININRCLNMPAAYLN